MAELTPLEKLAAASALFASVAAGFTVSSVVKSNSGSAATRCFMFVGQFESASINLDSVFVVADDGSVSKLNGSLSITTQHKVPPQYVNRNLTMCATGLKTTVDTVATGPVPTGCVSAVSLFYANERTSGGPSSVDTLLYVPPKGAQRDSLLRVTGGLPDLADQYVEKPVQICNASVPLMPKLAL